MMKRRPPVWAACLVLLLAACGQADRTPKNSITVKLPAAGAPIPPGSSYTSLNPASCRTAESVGHCEGPAGYTLETGRQMITIVAPDGKRSELDLARLTKSSRLRLGAKAEWRGAVPGHPTALIVRANRDLVVARLNSPACVVAVIRPQARQNEKAREVADGEISECLH